ncbi:DUF726-domain-containing protein [Saitoella complicata NRRL Y-17804]|uniref:DUF726-domain-containing protein n=1 Tax=Saitoella complicata (strain BCRC 22490 / CBS 7301 / JCM 7358 / NBRC 10748 / NRRL Y-17804) TaxID=698492 RepID=UPI000867A9C3|nr:DUF726-domain-containing protein [Saitoella complicata NRRL Y-17804]ODQ56366.1 DUF726-domain-containing protein [Saitoella complicata NRRL Y-17804]
MAKDQDLTTLLSPSQRADFLVLIATAIGVQRKRLLSAFDVDPGSAKQDSRGTIKDTEVEDVKDIELHYDSRPSSSGESSGSEEAPRIVQVDIKMEELKKAASEHFDEWQASCRQGRIERHTDGNLDKSLSKEEHPTINPERPAPTSESTNPLAVQTPLTEKLSSDRPPLLIHTLLLLLLSLKSYSAYSRILLMQVAASLSPASETIPPITEIESKVAQALTSAAKEMSADEESKKRAEQAATSRKWKVGLATLAGGVLVGVTGGLAAPLVAAGIGSVMGGIGLGATAAAGYLGALAGSSVLVGGLFGGYGAKMAGKMVDRYSAEIADFKFIPIHVNSKLHVTIGITGWLSNPEEVVDPWTILSDAGDQYALRFEVEALTQLGHVLESYVKSKLYGYVKGEILKRTVLATLMTALWPLGLLQAGKLLDNPWSIAYVRAQKAGQVLADALINRAQGERPVTLIGFSLGARVIHSCLLELARRKAFGVVENVYLLGTPAPARQSDWRAMRAVVAGRLVNVWSSNDYILAFLYRTSAVELGVAGLQAIEGVPGVENIDVSDFVEGHLRYRYMVGEILKDRVGLVEDLVNANVQRQLTAGERKGREVRLAREAAEKGDKKEDLIVFDADGAHADSVTKMAKDRSQSVKMSAGKLLPPITAITVGVISGYTRADCYAQYYIFNQPLKEAFTQEDLRKELGVAEAKSHEGPIQAPPPVGTASGVGAVGGVPGGAVDGGSGGVTPGGAFK